MKSAGRVSVRFAFVGYGTQVIPGTERPNRLYLDVGNELVPGVIDHHQLTAYYGSAAGLLRAHPGLLEETLKRKRRGDNDLTIVLHESPDLDCIASAYLAVTYLAMGEFPAGAELLTRYVDRIDAGHPGMTLENPFSLYSACTTLSHNLSLRSWNRREDLWNEWVWSALEVVAFAVSTVERSQTSLLEIDAFSTPGLFSERDRDEVRGDITRYREKLAHPDTCARRTRLRLPGQAGGFGEVDALLVRDVQNADDPKRVVFFKDWARTDRQLCGGQGGFAALSVFQSGSAMDHSRSTISVPPDSIVCLRGLAALLDQAESDQRTVRLGVDDRQVNPATGEKLRPRGGYDNADPWYDGRAHGYTIVDSPRSGTMLPAQSIEDLFLRFGHSSRRDVEPIACQAPSSR